MKQIIVTLFLHLVLAALAGAQSGVPFNQRDDAYPLLGLKRAKKAYELANDELRRNQELHDKKLISQLDLAKARNSFADAEVNYQQSMLSVLFESQYVAVREAVKFQGDDGKKHVRLKLQNTSGGDAEFKHLVNMEDDEFRSLQPDVVHDVYVSLLNSENAIISQPYEAKIERLKFGQPVTIDFTLLQDLDAVTVNMVYGNGTQRAPKIYLQKDATVNKVLVQSQQFSQEVELGGAASYDLTLELFSGEENTFKLAIVNLPSQINHYFRDPESEARLSQFKFTQTTNTRQAALQIFLPDRPTDQVAIDKPIAFYALVIPRDRLAEINLLKTEQWTPDEIASLDIGYVRLELVPRGVGKLLTRAPQLFHTIKPDEIVDMTIELVNEGSRRLDNIEIETDLPLNWTDEVTPNLVPALDIREEQRVALRFLPPKDVPPGRYEVRIRSSSLSDDQPVNGEDKTVTIEVEPEANVVGTTVIALLIIGLVGGIVGYGMKLSRR